MGDISFDKDGLRTAVVFAEMADRLYREGKTCVQRLRELYAKYGYFEMCTSYFYYKDAEVLSNIFKPLRGEGSPENFIKSMGEYKVTNRSKLHIFCTQTVTGLAQTLCGL